MKHKGWKKKTHMMHCTKKRKTHIYLQHIVPGRGISMSHKYEEENTHDIL